jgi:hypothetical protein
MSPWENSFALWLLKRNKAGKSSSWRIVLFALLFDEYPDFSKEKKIDR